jgi:uncharacterized iron-regulated membrane protein
MFRKTLFWSHLVAGVTTGVVVLMMSVTGVILTYERQMLDWANRDHYQSPPAGADRLPIEDLVAGLRLAEPDFSASSVSIARDPTAAVIVGAGRSGSRYVNGYTGEVLEDKAAGMDAFFGAVTGWHRWFNKSGAERGPWRAITGASNLAFLFLIVSGIYLWLPKMWQWAAFKTRLIFRATAATSQARDFNWHHFFGFWTAIPLAIVVATAVVFSYPWGSDLVYRAFGEVPPGRSGPPAARPAEAAGVRVTVPEFVPEFETAGVRVTVPELWGGGVPSLDALFLEASRRLPDWERISVTLPEAEATTVEFSIDQGNGGMPQRRHSLTLDAISGEAVEWAPFASQTPARQARSWVRFLHTGEALGIVGQTIAGFVSLTSVLMVYTGLALAYRRLIIPLLRRRRADAASTAAVSQAAD